MNASIAETERITNDEVVAQWLGIFFLVRLLAGDGVKNFFTESVESNYLELSQRTFIVGEE